ncbi:MAG: Mov34/MPN/PAD-1 family protein [Phycisphaerales bacterium]|nr:Mov34/MPN/PAD-1 family protein [Phycisphaerales bacterium]
MRLVIASHADETVRSHLAESVERELGGFLIGSSCASDEGLQTTIASVFPCRNAPGSLCHLTFTPDCWQEVHEWMNRNEEQADIVGWYHSHPGMHTRMSSQDEWLHQHFFDDPRFIAWIHDPIANSSSFWHWDSGPRSITPVLMKAMP